ncbi:MAG: WD40-repeat-containing domain protein [Benniella sp.]|nr:MAG: WD40-repeat-containing domain protein [Benniella sp.]
MGCLDTRQTLKRANFHMENASKTTDPKFALGLCEDAESALSQARKAVKGKNPDEELRKEVAAACFRLGNLQESLGQTGKAEVSYQKAIKLGHVVKVQDQSTTICDAYDSAQTDQRMLSLALGGAASGPLSLSPDQATPHHNAAVHSILDDMPSPRFPKLPKPFENLEDTPQLVYCLSLLKASQLPDEAAEPNELKWVQATKENANEETRLKRLAKDVIREFTRDELKDAKAVAEVVCLAPILDREEFRYLLKKFYDGIEQSSMLEDYQLEGLARVIQCASPNYLDADDLVKVFQTLGNRLKNTHHQSTVHIFSLAQAVCNVLDAMVDIKAEGLERGAMHGPLLLYFDELKKSNDPYMIYQAAYAFQALKYVPDNETPWQEALQRTGKVIRGVAGLARTMMVVDIDKFTQGLENIQKGAAGASGAIVWTKDARVWYPALRGVNAIIQAARFVEFEEFINKIPCRYDPAFQWGVCQRLGEVAADSKRDPEARKVAIDLLGNIYKDDKKWGQNATIKQWVVKILLQLTSLSGSIVQDAKTLLRELETTGEFKKQALFEACREEGASSYPLMVTLPQLESPSLLDRAQSRPEVERNLCLLREQRMKERDNVVYIQPQAKESLQSSDEKRFLLIENVNQFLEKSDQKVFLILGDSGAGKSTFNLELEYELWQKYTEAGRIPLYISLPTIDKPEHDMIAKQLRKVGFMEPQVRELKLHREFILICDGYDESQQSHNLYISNRLNQSGEWNAKMVISCRSEYLGVDYRDRFRPVDRNREADPEDLQEAVITPFSEVQIQDYISQYVQANVELWKVKEYQDALNYIPGLKDLVKNPFMLTLSMNVLPRLVDPEESLSSTRITRVALYDQFIEHWLERGKKRLGEKTLSSQAKAAFDGLNDEGFAQNGISFMKKLAVAIYKEQDGHPVVEYLRFSDQESWKAAFFGREEEKQLLREACPLVRNGSQYRFIHRSLLEYGLARAVFDPHERRKQTIPASVKARRGSASSFLSFEIRSESQGSNSTIAEQQDDDFNSPLVSRSFVGERSLLQFLQERVQQEPTFKKQLLDFIERSKTDKKWRTAAANAITILVRAGVQFNSIDLRGIQIPGADLSYGVFDSAYFQRADLRKVNFHNTWLRQANFWKAQMSGSRFGEFLTEESKVLVCAYPPGDMSLALGLDSGSISVYSATNWKKIQTLNGHDGRVTGVVYSPKGDHIVSGSQDKTIRLWKLDTGFCLRTLSGHTGEVTSVVHSPKASMVFSGSTDGAVRLWNTETGDCIMTMTLSDRDRDVRVTSVAYSSETDVIASGSSDGIVRLWNPAAGKCLQILSGHDGEVTSVDFLSKDVVSGGKDKTLKLWDSDTGSCRHTFTGHGEGVTSISCSPKGDMIASGSEDKMIKIWDMETNACCRTITGHIDRVTSVAFFPKGDKIASSSWDMTTWLWNVEARTTDLSLSGYDKSILAVVFSPDEGVVTTGSSDGTLRLWDTTTGDLLDSLVGSGSEVTGVDFSSEGDFIVWNCVDHTVHLLDLGTKTRHSGFSDQCRKTISFALSPKGFVVVTGNTDHSVQLWNATTGASIRVLEGHTGQVVSVTFSSSGDMFASGSVDCTVRLWNIETSDCRHVLNGHTSEVSSVSYSPNGDKIASGSEDKTTRLWDAVTGDCRSILRGHNDRITSVSYSSQGDFIATASNDKTVRLWDVEWSQCRAVIQCFSKVNSIAWGPIPSSSNLVTGCDDGSVRLWRVIEDGDKCRVLMEWSSLHGVLSLADATIQDVRGLNHANTRLLKQHGATGEPGINTTTNATQIFAGEPPQITFTLSYADG